MLCNFESEQNILRLCYAMYFREFYSFMAANTRWLRYRSPLPPLHVYYDISTYTENNNRINVAKIK